MFLKLASNQERCSKQYQLFDQEVSKKQNIPSLSNYSSCSASNTPKQILQKTIQLKNKHITDLMDQLKQTKSSYEDFKLKLSQENTKLKNQNQLLKKNIHILAKDKQNCKKDHAKSTQEKQRFFEQYRSLQTQSQSKLASLNKQLEDLQIQNKKLSKNLSIYQKAENQRDRQSQQVINKVSSLQHQLHEAKQKLVMEQKAHHQKIQTLLEENTILKDQRQKLKRKKKAAKDSEQKLDKLEKKIFNIMESI